LLWIVAGFVVSYVRTFAQYHRYSWDSITEFFASWFVHYIAVAFLYLLSYLAINAYSDWFLEDETDRSEFTMDKAMVYVPIFCIVLSLCIFVLAHWPASELIDQ
jgi:hypothetical protein